MIGRLTSKVSYLSRVDKMTNVEVMQRTNCLTTSIVDLDRRLDSSPLRLGGYEEYRIQVPE